MRAELHFDEELNRRLPLPLAQLYRRAHNAKTLLNRHLTAFSLWEASIKLVASVAVVEYAEGAAADPQFADMLQSLSRPSLGHWWEYVRRLLPVLADAGDEPFRNLRDLVLGRTRSDFPRAAALDSALRETLDGNAQARPTVRFTELFDRLVRYRNTVVLGHGAPGQLPDDFNDRMGRALLAGGAEVLGRLDALAGRKLLYLGEVRQSGGVWLVPRFQLTGENALRLPTLELPRDQASHLPNGERIHLGGPAVRPDGPELRPLSPLLLFDGEGSEVLFLNARRGKQRTEYLCYTTGRTLDRPDMGLEQRRLLARVLGMEVGEEQVAQWAARSQVEEPVELQPDRTAPRTLGEFELLSELGRGGMGVVYRAWQPSLNRQVALKSLLEPGDARTEKRFRREIRALGRVEHPHLIKVFTSGADADRLFYAMELVEGVPLSAVCDRLVSNASSGDKVDLETWQGALSTVWTESRQKEKPLATPSPLPAERPASSVALAVPLPSRNYVRHIVELVRQAAEAAHLLHEAGIVHRDIKPGNIMVSADGTQAVLMDLGLAQLADDEEGRLTRTRQFVGTLRYASPQQVLAVGNLDRRTDVYSLGATLWELLTLRPLYGATDLTPTPELMEKIQREDPDRLRKYQPRASRDLEAVVARCMEKDATRRYPTASDLAADLRCFLAGEPVRARPIRGFERSLRWLRRRPAVAALLAVCLLALVAAGLGLTGYVLSIRAEQARTAAQRDLAQRRLEFSLTAVERMLARNAEVELLSIPLMEQARRRMLQDALNLYQELLAEESADAPMRFLVARTRAKLGALLDILGRYDEGGIALQQSRLECERLTTEFPDESKYRLLFAEVLRAVGQHWNNGNHPQEAEECHHQSLAVLEQFPPEFAAWPEVQRSLITAWGCLANSYKDQHRQREARQALDKALALSRALIAGHPDLPQLHLDHIDLLSEAANQARRQQKRQQASLVLEEARAVLRGFKGIDANYQKTFRMSTASLIVEQAVLAREMGKALECERRLLEAIHLLKGLVGDFPSEPNRRYDLVNAYCNLAYLYADTGRPGKALEKARQAIEQAQGLVEHYPTIPRYSEALATIQTWLGDVLRVEGQAKEALQFSRDNEQFWSKQVGRFPKTPFARIAQVSNQLSLGQALSSDGQYGQAEACNLRALKQVGTLLSAHPDNADIIHLQFRCHRELGDVSLAIGKLDQATGAFRQAIDLGQRLVKAFPFNPDYAENLAIIYAAQAELAAQRQEVRQAQQHYQEARKILERLVDDHPEKVYPRSRLGMCHSNLGHLWTDAGRWEDAEKELRTAVVVYQQLTVDFPDWVMAQRQLACAHAALGYWYYQTGRLDKAETGYRAAQQRQEKLHAGQPSHLDYRNDLAQGHLDLSYILWKQQSAVPAEQHVRKALSLWEQLVADLPRRTDYQYKLGRAQCQLATVLEGGKKAREAEAAYAAALATQEKLIALVPGVSKYRASLGDTLNELGVLLSWSSPEKAGDAYRKGLAVYDVLVKETPSAKYRDSRTTLLFNLGEWLHGRGLFLEAEKMHDAAFAIRARLHKEFPNTPGYRSKFASSQAARGWLFEDLNRYKEAEDAFGAALRLREKLVADYPASSEHRETLGYSLHQLAWLLKLTDRPKESETLYRRAVAVREQLVEAAPTLPDPRANLAATHQAYGFLLDELDRNPEAERCYKAALVLRESLVKSFPGVASYRKDLAQTLHNMGNLCKAAGRASDAEALYLRSRTLRESLAAAAPGNRDYRFDLSWSHHQLARLWSDGPKAKQAEAAFRQAIALQEALVKDFPDIALYRKDLAQTLHNLANFLKEADRAADAEPFYLRSRELREKLVVADPKNPDYCLDLSWSHQQLAFLWSGSGKVKQAEAAFRQAMAVREGLAKDWPAIPAYRDHLAQTLHNLGNFFKDRGRAADAEAFYLRSRALRAKLVAADPKNPDYRVALAWSHQKLASLLWSESEKAKQAEAAFRQAMAVREGLAKDWPDSASYKEDLAQTLHDLANLLKDGGRTADSEPFYLRSRDLREKLVSADPKNRDYRVDLAWSHHQLGRLWSESAKAKQAEAAFRKAVVLREKLVADFPNDVDVRGSLAEGANTFGNFMRQQKRFTNAVSLYRQAVMHWRKLIQGAPMNLYYRQECARAYTNLTRTFEARGELEDAIVAVWAAIALHEKLAQDYPDNRGIQAALRDNRVTLARLVKANKQP